jgi:hypothetical protein
MSHPVKIIQSIPLTKHPKILENNVITQQQSDHTVQETYQYCEGQ